MRKNLQIVDEKARQRAKEQLAKEAEQVLQQIIEEMRIESDKIRRQIEEEPNNSALSIVDETFGAIKGLDALTLIHLAEDEEFSGY